MNVLKTLAVLGIAIVAVGLGKESASDDAASIKGWIAERTGAHRSSGFEAIPLPEGASSRGIVVFAPKHCTSDAMRCTEELVRYLSDQGIAYIRTDTANYSTLATREESSQVTLVMNGPAPVVYVHGRAKANPTPQEVVAEYRGISGATAGGV